LLPDRSPKRTGRPRVSDRAAFTAIVFVLRTGVPLAVTLTGGNRNDITQLLDRSSTASRPSQVGLAGRVSGLTGSSPTGVTTTPVTSASYGAAASNRASLGAEPSTARG
jgi:hypothetical protein